MNRRKLLKAAAVAAAGPVVMGMGRPTSSSAAETARPTFANDDFYTQGKFDEDKTKDAVLALCKWFGYPMFPGMRDGLWVSDYGTGQYARLGLAAYIFVNHHDAAGTYMMLDIILFPNQMLPEHWHLEGDHGITKTEGWLVRWGKNYIGGVGEDNLASFPQVNIPPFHCNGTTTTRHVVEAASGTFVPLAEVGSRHWQFAGPDGAIVTEVANFHTGPAVRHSDQVLNDFFLGN